MTANKDENLIDDNKSSSLPQPEGTGKTSPVSGSETKEEKSSEELLEKLQTTQEELEKTKKFYGDSSTEAKRLVGEVKEIKENLSEKDKLLADKQKEINELNEYVDILETDEKKEEKTEEEKIEKELEKELEKEPEKSFLDEDKTRKITREEIKKEKEIEVASEKQIQEARKKYPALRNKGYSNRVSDKMDSHSGMDIFEACKEVSKDIEFEREGEEEETPFVEGGKGSSGSTPSGKEDEILGHLERKSPVGGLGGLG